MKFSKRDTLLFVGALALLVFGFNNCSKENFSASATDDSTTTPPTGAGTDGTNVSPCAPQKALNLRIMFMVDDSGSTNGDDAGANVRGQSIIDFINQNINATNLSYSFNYFILQQQGWDFSTSSFTSSPTQVFGNGQQTLAAANAFVKIAQTTTKIKGTNYDNPFQALKSMVAADAAANPGYNYVVIFMSDGQPNDGNDTVTDNIDTNLVTPLMTTGGKGHITISSVYFNTAKQQDSIEQTLMDNIGNLGLGLHVDDVTDVKPLDLATMVQNLIIVPTAACPAGS